jgi:hypothetical protein
MRVELTLTLIAEREPGPPRKCWMQQYRVELAGNRLVRVSERVAQRCDEQHQRCDPLLTVDERPLGDLAAAGNFVKDRAEEMGLPGIPNGNGADVRKQLLTPVELPAVTCAEAKIRRCWCSWAISWFHSKGSSPSSSSGGVRG